MAGPVVCYSINIDSAGEAAYRLRSLLRRLILCLAELCVLAGCIERLQHSKATLIDKHTFRFTTGQYILRWRKKCIEKDSTGQHQPS